jgi:hypothetical protein
MGKDLRWLIVPGVLVGGFLIAAFFLRPSSPEAAQADEFKVVQLSGNPQHDEAELNRYKDEAFEYVTSITPPGTKQPVLVFRKGQLSNFQRHMLALNVRSWYLNAVWALISLFALLGLLATFASLRASVYSQVYQRYQAVILKFMDKPELFYSLFLKEQPVAISSAPAESNVAAGTPAQTDAEKTLIDLGTQAAFSVFEEIYLLRHDGIAPWLPDRVWKFWEQIIKKTMKRKHCRDFISSHQDTYGKDFLQFCLHLARE